MLNAVYHVCYRVRIICVENSISRIQADRSVDRELCAHAQLPLSDLQKLLLFTKIIVL